MIVVVAVAVVAIAVVVARVVVRGRCIIRRRHRAIIRARRVDGRWLEPGTGTRSTDLGGGGEGGGSARRVERRPRTVWVLPG